MEPVVQLRSVLRPDLELRRMLPALAIGSLAIWVIAVVVFSLFGLVDESVWLATPFAAAYAATLYLRRRRLLRAAFDKLLLQITPHGLVRYDGSTVIDMPWRSMVRIEARNSLLTGRSRRIPLSLGPSIAVVGAANAAAALATRKTADAVVGWARITPMPGAIPSMLAEQDRLGGDGPILSSGHVRITERGLIFFREFEQDWRTGVIGAALRTHRPDLLPPG